MIRDWVKLILAMISAGIIVWNVLSSVYTWEPYQKEEPPAVYSGGKVAQLV